MRTIGDEIARLTAEIASLRAVIAEAREALEPFAGIAEIFDHPGGNRPTSGTIYGWADHRVGERTLTIEGLRAARAARARIAALDVPTQQETTDE